MPRDPLVRAAIRLGQPAAHAADIEIDRQPPMAQDLAMAVHRPGGWVELESSAQLGDESLQRGEAGRLRQLPQPAEQPLGGAAGQEDAPAAFGPHRIGDDERLGRVGHALADDRQLVDSPARGRLTQIDQRAGVTARRGLRAHLLAELHEPLVEIGRRVGGDQLGGDLPQQTRGRRRLHVVVDGVEPRQDARHVAVDQRLAPAKRDRRDRPRRVTPHAGQSAKLGGALRHLPGPARHDLARPAMEMARAPVIAEPGPGRQHVVERRRGQGGEAGEASHPALVIRHRRRDTGLLQHHFGDPDRIGIAGPSPREVAPISAVPTHHARRYVGRKGDRAGSFRLRPRLSRSSV